MGEAFRDFVVWGRESNTKIPFHVISLLDEPQRQLRIKTVMEEAGVKYKIRKFLRDSQNPVRGCFSSHTSLYKECVRKNLPWIAVCEDNVVLPREVHQGFFLELEEFLASQDFDLVYLCAIFNPFGSPCVGERARGCEKVFRVNPKDMLGASTYVISQKACRKLLEIQFRGKAIDVEFTTLSNRFIYKPLLFHHAVMGSSVNSHMDLPRKFLFSSSNYHTSEERYFSGCSGIWGQAIFLLFVITLVVAVVSFLVAWGLLKLMSNKPRKVATST